MKSEFIPPVGKILQISGKCISLIGNDIDTDRIIPARFLKCINFDALGNSVFEDDRKTLKGRHPLDLQENKNASILIVNSKFWMWIQQRTCPPGTYEVGYQSNNR